VGFSTPLVFSRTTIARIFQGVIRHWNDTAIISDNYNISSESVNITGILSKLQKNINLLVRSDDSGISMIVQQTLSSFDPVGDEESSDYSFAHTIGSSKSASKPIWCDSLTDEVQILRIENCHSNLSLVQKEIVLSMVTPTYQISSVRFLCNSSAVEVQNAILQQSGITVIVYAVTEFSSVDSFAATYRVGYYDSRLFRTNWYLPSVQLALDTPLQVSMTAMQEGGLANSHYSGDAYVTQRIDSLFVSNSSVGMLNFTCSNGDFETFVMVPILSGGHMRGELLNAISQLGIQVNVTAIPHNSSLWEEYQIVFSSSGSSCRLNNSAVGPPDAHYVTLLSANNYPSFFGPTYLGGFKFTCYKRQFLYQPWEYYTGNVNVMNAKVRESLLCCTL
jgi:hypothetical protein